MDILKIFQFKIGQNNIQNRVYKKRKKIELNKGAFSIPGWKCMFMEKIDPVIFFIIFYHFYHKKFFGLEFDEIHFKLT